jgi:chromate transporter
LGLAETTPGPLIIVVQFVGFLAAWRHPGDWSPLTAALLGSAVTLWATFTPSFLWVFLGGPYVERLRQVRALSAALSAVTAAVVGVVLNLALWFACATLFRGEMSTASMALWQSSVAFYYPSPAWSRFSWPAAGLAILAAVLLLRLRWNLFAVMGLCVALGAVFFGMGWR